MVEVIINVIVDPSAKTVCVKTVQKDSINVPPTIHRQESHGNPRLAFVADFHDIELFGR